MIRDKVLVEEVMVQLQMVHRYSLHHTHTHNVHLKALKVFDFSSKQLIDHFTRVKDFPIKCVCVILLQSFTEDVNPSWISAPTFCCHTDAETLRKCITLWCLFQVCYSARPLKGRFFSVHVLSLEVQGRAWPDAQKCIRLNCKIKCFVFHYCSSKCLRPNRKDESVWYQYGNVSAFIVLWCLCQHELVTADVCLMPVTYLLLYLCATFVWAACMVDTHGAHTHTHKTVIDIQQLRAVEGSCYICQRCLAKAEQVQMLSPQTAASKDLVSPPSFPPWGGPRSAACRAAQQRGGGVEEIRQARDR